MVGGVTAGQHGSSKQQYPDGSPRPGSKGGSGDSEGECVGGSAGSGGKGGDGTEKGKYLSARTRNSKSSQSFANLTLRGK